MSRAAIDGIPLLLAWGGAGYKLKTLHRRPHDRGLQILCSIFLSVALALTVGLPPVHALIDQSVGIPNIAQLLKGSLAVIGGWNVQRYFIYLANEGADAERAFRRSRRVLLLTLLVLIILFVLAPIDATELTSFTGRYADSPFVMEYQLVLLSYMALTMYSVARYSRRYTALVKHRPATRLGLWLSALGGAFSLLYAVHKGSLAIAYRLAIDYPGPDPELVSDLLKGVVVTLLVLGATIPAWGPYVGIPALYQWVAQYRACRDLYPLWVELCRAMPELALVQPTPGWTDALNVRDIRFRMRRRATEIRDGHLALRSFADAEVVNDARSRALEQGLSAEEAEAAADAAGLASALRAKTAGRVPVLTGSRLVSPPGTGLDGELAYLRKIARHYNRSSTVRQAPSKHRRWARRS